MDGILVAAGLDVRARGVLSDQKLVEVAGGIFDLLGVPPMPGMVSNAPAWAQPYAGADGADLREKLSRLGYT